MIKLTIDSQSMQSQLAALAAQVDRPRVILQAAGRSVARLLQDHFIARDRSEPNQLGGRRTHWWGAMVRATQLASVDDHEAVVSISQPGVAQKVFGGTITPKLAKWLSIPATAEAHGRRPKTYTMTTGIGLRFVKTGPDKAMLVQAEGTLVRPKKKGKPTKGREVGGLVVYWLSKSVTQSPDPKALPPRSAIEGAAIAAAEAQVAAMRR